MRMGILSLSFVIAMILVAVCSISISADEHPRIWLDSEALSTLRQRAVAATPEWVALKSCCDEYLTGIVEWPDGDDYPGDGSIGEGYQGDGYFHPLLNLGLCYQVVKEVEPAKAPFYAAKGVEILVKMSEPPGSPHSVNPLRDDGYGIRFFGVGMAIGYDWFYDATTPEQRTRVYQALNYWIAEFDAGGFRARPSSGKLFRRLLCGQGSGSFGNGRRQSGGTGSVG